MPRYTQPQRNSSGPRNDLIKKEADAENGRKSMPGSLSMGNEALQDMLAGGGPLVIPVGSGNESMSLVIESDREDEKVPESDQEQSLDDLNYSEIDTSKKALERMRNPKVELVDPKGHAEEIKSESDAPKVVKDAEEHAGNPEDGQPGELAQADKDMQPVQELNFQPVRMKENKLKMEGGFLSTITQFLGITVGKAIGTVFNLGLLPFTGAIIAKDFIKSWWNKGSLQEKRDHKKIPGWDGAEFEEDKRQNDNEVNVDFRKVPAVWSYPIASKAAEMNRNAENQNDPKQREKPLDPIVSVLVDQPKEGSADSIINGEMGHTMLGIEYSRFSRISNRYERYRIKYGFYPAGGLNTSAAMMMVSRDAVVPGQLYNDVAHKYTISRRFKAKPAQVNAIMKASETYADKGYGYFTRNCTTFVKDMVQNVGHITKLAEPIFQQDAVQFGYKERLGMFAAKSFNLNAEAGMENLLMDLGKRQDQTYENFGNKRATQQDYNNYKKSLDHEITIQKYTEIPAMVGENLRRASGEHAGEVDSWKYTGNLKKLGEDEDEGVETSLQSVMDACEHEAMNLKALIREILADTSPEQIPPELLEIIEGISTTGLSLWDLEDKTKKYCKDKNIPRTPDMETEALTQDDLREAGEALDADISRLQRLQKYFKNDERLHMPIVHLISLVNWGHQLVDYFYLNIRRGKNNPGELGDIRGEMRYNTFEVGAGDKVAVFTPTLYEAYLQIYKTPEAAVKNKARYDELSDKLNDGDDLTAAENKEMKKFERLERTVEAFKTSHDYLLEKDTFSPQDVQYIFNLQAKEKQGVESEAFSEGKTSAQIYQSLLFEKVFGGMKERFLSQEDFKNDGEPSTELLNELKKWLDNELEQSANRKFSNLITLMTGMKRAMPDPTKDEMVRQFYMNMRTVWIDRIFDLKNFKSEFQYAAGILPRKFSEIMGDQGSKFRKVVDKVIQFILSEDNPQRSGPVNPKKR